MKLAMSNIAWAPDDRLAAYALLKDAGLHGLEIAPGLFFHGAENPLDPDEATGRQAVAEMTDAGLELVSMQSLLFNVADAALFEGAERLERFETGMLRAIALAGRFQIPNLVFGSPKQRVVPDDMALADAETHAIAVFRRLGDAAAAAGTSLSVEANPAPYGTNFLNRVALARAFVAQVDHPAVTLIMDLGEIHINESFDDIEAIVNEAAPFLRHVHVSEPFLAPAPGTVDTASRLLAALSDIDYAHWVSIEMKQTPEGLTAVEASLARLVAAAKGMEAAA